jgi:hypothetical protein
MNLIAKTILPQVPILIEPAAKVLKEAPTPPSPLQMEVPTTIQWQPKIHILTT